MEDQAARAIKRAARRGQTPGWIDPTQVDAVGDLGATPGVAAPAAADGPDLNELTVNELQSIAEDLDIEGRSRMRKADLIEAIRKA